MFQLVSAYIQKQLCWCSANACLERDWCLQDGFLPVSYASLLKDSVRSEHGIMKMSCFVFQTLILNRSAKLAIRKVSEVKCWDQWMQWTLRNNLHYIKCDRGEFRGVLSCRLFWNTDIKMFQALPFSPLFNPILKLSLITPIALVLNLLLTSGSIQKLALLLSVEMKCFLKDLPQEVRCPAKALIPVSAAH